MFPGDETGTQLRKWRPQEGIVRIALEQSYGLKDSVTTPMGTSEFPSELCQTLLLAKPI